MSARVDFALLGRFEDELMPEDVQCVGRQPQRMQCVLSHHCCVFWLVPPPPLLHFLKLSKRARERGRERGRGKEERDRRREGRRVREESGVFVCE